MIQSMSLNFPRVRGGYAEAVILRCLRVRGRQIAVRIESSDVGSGWHLGDFRYEIRSDGKR